MDLPARSGKVSKKSTLDIVSNTNNNDKSSTKSNLLISEKASNRAIGSTPVELELE